MRLIRTALTLVCAAPLLVAEDALPSQDQLTGDLKKQEAALVELNTKIQGVRDTLAKDLDPMLKAAQEAEAAFNKAWQEDTDLVAARKAEGEAHQGYAKALDQAVAEDADGKTLLGKISQLDDDSWELEVKRRLAQIERENALRPSIERKDPEVTAAGQKLNSARGRYDQRDRNIAEFQAARQRIETAQQAAQKLENAPEIQAARKAVDDLLAAPALTPARVALQEASAAYETLRRDHPLTKAYEQAGANHTKALEQAVAQNVEGKALIDRINQINDDIFERDIQRTLARLEIDHAVRPRMQRKNVDVLAAAQKVNDARMQYEQRDNVVAEFKAARQRINAAAQTVQKLENSPGIQAARAALQEANTAYETLRRDHPLTKAHEQAGADYTKALEQAVAQNPDGKALIDRINQISDDIFEREIQRTLAQVEIDHAVRPRMQRKNVDVLAAAQKVNDARVQYDQRDNVAEFKAARQRIETAQRIAQTLEGSAEIQAARKVLSELLAAPELAAARQAVQEANNAYEQLRTNHAVTKSLVEADQQYRTLVADKVAASDLGKILATTTNEADVSLKANQVAREKAQQDINGVRGKMEKENQTVLAAAKARQEASEKRQAAERSEAITKLAQARDSAMQAYREALAKAETDKGLPDLAGKQDATTKQIAATQAILRALDLSSKIKPVTVEAGHAVTIAVLINDADPNNRAISLASVTDPAQGKAAISGRTVVYTSHPGFTGNDSFTYTMRHAIGTAATATVRVTVVDDVTPPRVQEVFSHNAPGTVMVVFDEPVAAGSGAGGAENPSNYALDRSVEIAGASLAGDLCTVTLNVKPAMTFGTTYTLTVNRLTDRAAVPNPIASNTRVSFECMDCFPGVAYWAMNEPLWAGVAGEVRDRSAGGCHGQAQGNANTGAGKIGRAGVFTGGRVIIPDAPRLRLGGVHSLAFWVRIDEPNGDWLRLVGKGENDTRNFSLWRSTGGEVLYQIQTAAGWGNVQGGRLEVGSGWHHLAGTCDGNVMVLYHDGQEVARGNLSGTPVTSAAPVTLGYADFHQQGFTGGLDEVRLFDRALSAEEVASLVKGEQIKATVEKKAEAKN